MPEEDQRSFDFSGSNNLKTLEDVLKATEEKRTLCQENMWKFTWNGKEIILRDVVDDMVKWVNKFQSLGAMVAQVDPVHFAIPWTAVQFLLKVCFLSPTNLNRESDEETGSCE